MMRGDGFDADAGFTIVEVVVASTLLLVAFLAAAGLFEAGTRVSGDTRMRVDRRPARVVGDREGPRPGRRPRSVHDAASCPARP